MLRNRPLSISWALFVKSHHAVIIRACPTKRSKPMGNDICVFHFQYRCILALDLKCFGSDDTYHFVRLCQSFRSLIHMGSNYYKEHLLY